MTNENGKNNAPSFKAILKKNAILIIVWIICTLFISLVLGFFVARSSLADSDLIELEVRFANIFAYRFDGSIEITLTNNANNISREITLNQNNINGGVMLLSVSKNSIYEITYTILPCVNECEGCLLLYNIVDRASFAQISTVTVGESRVVVNWTLLSVGNVPPENIIANDDPEFSHPHGEDTPSAENLAYGANLFIRVWESIKNESVESSFLNFFGRYFGNRNDPEPRTIWASQINDSVERFISVGGGTEYDWDAMTPKDRFMQSLYWDIQHGLERELAWTYINNDFYQFLGGFDMIARFVGRGNLFNMTTAEAQLAYNEFMYWQRQLIINYGLAFNFMDGYLHIEDALQSLGLFYELEVTPDVSTAPENTNQNNESQLSSNSTEHPHGEDNEEKRPHREDGGNGQISEESQTGFFSELLYALRNMWLTIVIIGIGGIVLLVVYLRKRSVNKLD